MCQLTVVYAATNGLRLTFGQSPARSQSDPSANNRSDSPGVPKLNDRQRMRLVAYIETVCDSIDLNSAKTDALAELVAIERAAVNLLSYARGLIEEVKGTDTSLRGCARSPRRGVRQAANR